MALLRRVARVVRPHDGRDVRRSRGAGDVARVRDLLRVLVEDVDGGGQHREGRVRVVPADALEAALAQLLNLHRGAVCYIGGTAFEPACNLASPFPSQTIAHVSTTEMLTGCHAVCVCVTSETRR